MKIRLIRATVVDGQGYPAETELDVEDGLGVRLVQMGRAEAVRQTIEAAVIEQRETAVTPARKRKQK